MPVPVNPKQVLKDYKDLFLELGVPEGTVSLKIVNKAQSIYGPSDVNQPVSLGRAILNDIDDRQLLGITERDTLVVKIWGGQLESSGSYEVTEDALLRAQLPGGGLLIRGRAYSLVEFLAGFTVGPIAMTWLLTCVGKRATF